MLLLSEMSSEEDLITILELKIQEFNADSSEENKNQIKFASMMLLAKDSMLKTNKGAMEMIKEIDQLNAAAKFFDPEKN